MTTIYLAILLNIFQMGHKRTTLKALFKAGLRETVSITSTVSPHNTASAFRVTVSISSLSLTQSYDSQGTKKKADFGNIS